MKKVIKFFKFLLFSIGALIIIVCILFGYMDRSVDDLKSTYAQPPSAFVLMNGMNVHYRDEGNPLDSLPIVLIHGTGSSLHTFDVWAATLKNKNG